jgi:plasmid stability protein
MSTVVLQLPDEIELKLQSRAKDEGRDVASIALEILATGLAADATAPTPSVLPYEEWKREFDAWVRSRPWIDVVLDDSRETIYEGR